MSEPRGRLFVSIWDDDDPAIARGREALALRPVEGLPSEAKAEAAPDSTAVPVRQAAEATARRGRIAQLVARIRAGDLSARQALEELLK